MWCAFSEMLGCGGSASKPASPRDEGSVAEWLDGVGGAWGSKYGAAFVKAGYEDVEDIKTMPPDAGQLEEFLKPCGARMLGSPAAARALLRRIQGELTNWAEGRCQPSNKCDTCGGCRNERDWKRMVHGVSKDLHVKCMILPKRLRLYC